MWCEELEWCWKEYSVRVEGVVVSTVSSINTMICILRVKHKCRQSKL